MQRPSLETIATQLAEQLRCEQEDLCLPIISQVARGKPLEKAALATSLHVDQNELEQRLLHLHDTEFDQRGNIVGWGVTLVPTRHHFHIHGQDLFTWCAFDTLLFPPWLGATAQVHSTCPVTGRPIAFVATPGGTIKRLTPASAVMTLLIPAEQRDCSRANFCERSLFFASEQAASAFLTAHSEAFLLSIEEAAYIGKLVAQTRLNSAASDT